MVIVAWFLVLLDDTAVAVALPTLGRDLNLGLTGLQWVVIVYTLAFAVLTLWAGARVDRHGARPVFLAGLGVFTLASLAAGLTTGGTALIGTRFAQGAAAALIGPAALAMLLTSYAGRARAVALGIWSGAGAAALAAGPLLGALLTESFGWRSIFLVNVPLGAAALAAGRTALPGPAPAHAAESTSGGDLAGLAASAFGLFALIFGLTQANELGWRSLILWAILGLAASGLAAFIAIERRARVPLLPLSLFRLPNLLAANVLGLTALAVMCSLFFFLSLYLQLAGGYSPIRAGAASLPLTLLAAIGAPVSGWLASRASPRYLIAAGMALTAVGLLALARVDPQWGPRQLLPGLVLAGAGLGLATTPITMAATTHLPTRFTGVGSACLNAFRMVGLSAGVAVMGALVAARWPGDLIRSAQARALLTDGLATGFEVNAAVAVAAAVLAMTLVRMPITDAEPPTVE